MTQLKHLFNSLDWDILSPSGNILFSYECVCVVPEYSPLPLVVDNNVQQEQLPLLSLVPSIDLQTLSSIEFRDKI